MKLKVLDQIHVSAVQADTLQPGQEITVSETVGEALLKQHPTTFEQLDEEAEDDAEGDAKAAEEPQNKAAPAHADKAVTAPKRKRKGAQGAE